MMVEYGKEIAAGGVVAVAAVLFLATLIYNAPFGNEPAGLRTTTLLVTHTDVVPAGPPTITTTGGGSSNSNSSSVPALLLGIVNARGVSCSESTGMCNMTVVNDGRSPSFNVVVVGCDFALISSNNSTTTVYSDVQGAIGGQIVAIPYGMSVKLSCTVSPSHLSLQPPGSTASGSLKAELINTLSNYPPGTLAYAAFEGTWA